MKLYLIQHDGEPYYVESSSMGMAVQVWQDSELEGDDEPDSVSLIYDKPVIRDGGPLA